MYDDLILLILSKWLDVFTYDAQKRRLLRGTIEGAADDDDD